MFSLFYDFTDEHQPLLPGEWWACEEPERPHFAEQEGKQ
jgi:hypothetical protein